VVLVKIQMLATGCNNKKGFTLIEILIVLLIIGITTTLITLNFNSISSIEKQQNSYEETISFLTQESIVTGHIIGLYVDDSDQYAAFFDKNNQKEIIKSFKKLSKNNSGISKRTFKYQDGTIINLDDNKTTSPILLFYPSGENSGGIIELYYEENIQRILIKNNGEISNEILSY